MACDGEVKKTWFRVPNGSRLFFTIRSAQNTYAQDVRFRTCAGDACTEVMWSRPQTTPGPIETPLTSPETYDIEVRLEFQGSEPATVEIEARIERADGGTHDSTYCRSVSGTSGQSGRAFISIITSLS